MTFYHGSPYGGLIVLDPQKGILDPNGWAGVYPNGEKVDAAVVWVTPEFEVAMAFALKAFIDDLAVDGASKTIYLKSQRELTPEMQGFVYVVSPDSVVEEVNALEYFSKERLLVSACVRVSIASFTEYRVKVVERLPFEDEL